MNLLWVPFALFTTGLLGVVAIKAFYRERP
jgi:hypothetical protein